MKKTYTIAVTLPLSLWVEVQANNEAEARTLALNEAQNTKLTEWSSDTTPETDIVKVVE